MKRMENKIKGEKRERILEQRGEASNSVGVLSRLTGSGVILVFLK